MSTTAVLNLGINTSQFSQGLRGATSQLGGFAKLSGKLLAGSIVIGGALAVAGASFIKIASDAAETESKFKTVFSNIGESANAMSKELQTSYGLSTMESQRMLGATGDLLSGFGFAQKESLDLSGSIQKLAVDLASFQNLEGGAENASKRLTSALTGETEGLKALGIVIRQDSKEFKNSVKTIMETTGATLMQAKAQVILNEATKQSKNSIGDYAKTSKQLANQLRLTGAIWEDLSVGVGKFLMEVTGAEGVTVSFNESFRSMTDNLISYLKNWKQNWGILKGWLSDNIITIFTIDLPNAVSLWLKNGINNIAVFAKMMGDLFTQFGGWFIGFSARLFSGDFNNAITSGLQDAFKSMIRWGTEVWDNLVSIFKGDTGGNEFVANLEKGFDIALGSRSLTDTFKETISNAVDDIKMPLEGFKSATSDLKFLKYVPKDMSKSADDLNKALDPLAEENKKVEGKVQQPRQLESAVQKGSIEAFKKENPITNKIQNDQLKELKEQTKQLSAMKANYKPELIVDF